MNIVESFNRNIISNSRYLLIFEGIKNTLLIALFSCILGILIGVLVCYLRMSKNKIISGLAKVYIQFFRNIPIVLLLILTYYVVFAHSRISAMTVAIIAFALYHGAYASEIFRSGIISVKEEQIESSISMGFTKFQTFIYIILPQAIKVIFPVYKGEFITLIKLTSVVGYIGVRDLTRATDIIRSQTFDAFFPIIVAVIIYFIIIGILNLSLNAIEHIINPRKA